MNLRLHYSKIAVEVNTFVPASSRCMKGGKDMMQEEGGAMIHTIESNTDCSDRSKEQERRAVAMIHHEGIEGWGTIILSGFIDPLQAHS